MSERPTVLCKRNESELFVLVPAKVRGMNRNFVAKFRESFTKFRVINEISVRRTEISCERNEISLLKSS